MTYDRIPGVDENYRFPPEVEGASLLNTHGALIDSSTLTTSVVGHAINQDRILKTDVGGRLNANPPISNLHVVPKSYVDSRVPSNLPITEDNSVGKRIFIGDTMVYGDTGWRDIKNLIDPTYPIDPDAHGLVLRTRRTTHHLYYTFDISNLDGYAGAHDLLSYPQGFEFRDTLSYMPPGYPRSPIAWLGTGIKLTLTSSKAWARYQWALSTRVDQAWPTSLPGLPIGPLP